MVKNKRQFNNKSISFTMEEIDLYEFIVNYLEDSIPEATGKWSTYIKDLIKLDLATRYGKNIYEMDFKEINNTFREMQSKGKSIKNYFPCRNWGNFDEAGLKETNSINDDILSLIKAQQQTQEIMQNIILTQQESLELEKNSNKYLKDVISNNIIATKTLTEVIGNGISVNGMVVSNNVNLEQDIAKEKIEEKVENKPDGNIDITNVNIDENEENVIDFDDYF